MASLTGLTYREPAEATGEISRGVLYSAAWIGCGSSSPSLGSSAATSRSAACSASSQSLAPRTHLELSHSSP
eukprot:10926-Pyramimonas_sp.AAC.1